MLTKSIILHKWSVSLSRTAFQLSTNMWLLRYRPACLHIRGSAVKDIQLNKFQSNIKDRQHSCRKHFRICKKQTGYEIWVTFRSMKLQQSLLNEKILIIKRLKNYNIQTLPKRKFEQTIHSWIFDDSPITRKQLTVRAMTNAS